MALKGFRPGKVPPAVIKSQFGKSIYGEVVDKILRETSTKAIDEKKFKVAGQPKIDLKQFGEGKDLNYELQIDCLPSVTLKSFDKFKATEFKVKIENNVIDKKIKEISEQNKQFEDKNKNEKAFIGNYPTPDPDKPGVPRSKSHRGLPAFYSRRLPAEILPILANSWRNTPLLTSPLLVTRRLNVITLPSFRL